MQMERAIGLHAMYDAARAALPASGSSVEPEVAKTHSGLISAFSLHLVKTGRVSVELGKSLNKAAELRLMADYKGDPVEKEDAAWADTQCWRLPTRARSVMAATPSPYANTRGRSPRCPLPGCTPKSTLRL